MTMQQIVLRPPTELQARVFRYMRDYHRTDGIPPTVREVQKAFRWKSPNGALLHIKALIDKGWIVHRSRAARSYIPSKEALEHEDA